MTPLFRSIFPIGKGSFKKKSAWAAWMLAVVWICMPAQAQNTTISGTVFDPRTTASALPLPNVLVYITTGTVDPLPSGVQCMTYSAPQNVTSYAYTAVDGTFTLSNVPENTDYTLVIQAGKWRRQYPVSVGGAAVTGMALHMPADHTQGDIPLIAIATGSVDGVECVLHNMGIADTEFTDDNGTTNAGGRIHLYKGSHSPGAQISSSTPSATALMDSTSLLNSYDMVMFPCQGGAFSEPNAELANLVSYANAGGRVFATHYSYDWLDPDSPYFSQFPPVANWGPMQSSPSPDPGVATVNTGFTDGSTLAQWLQNAGAIYNNQPGQIQISTLRHDLNSVIPPTQSWLTLNNAASKNPIMQLTFNTPVGAPAANQCGRVLFNEYHVVNASTTGKAYPAECPSSATMNAPGQIAQVEMLEYALFDLSSFVQPVVVPTLSVAFNPSPLTVKQGDTADQVTIDVTNTSTTTFIDSSAVLTLTLPAHLTATALSDATGGWNCTVSTLTCTRSTSLPSSASDSVTLTVSVGSYQQGGTTPVTGSLGVTISSPTFSNDVTASDTVVYQQQPPVVWATPASIIYGTPLSATQLDATSQLQGTFTYTPPAGTVLAAGQQTLQVTFSPADTINFLPQTASVTLTVVPAVPAVTVTSSAPTIFLSASVTFTASVSSPATMPTGSVTFFDGATQIGTGTLSGGVGTFTTSSLSSGVRSITAVYSGDSNYQSATSGAYAQNVQDFTITIGNTGDSQTVYAGNPATYQLVITPVGGATVPADIAMSISGLPALASASFSPAVVAANSATTNVTLTINPTGQVGRNERTTGLPLALALVLLPFAARWRRISARWFRVMVLLGLAVAIGLGTSACGGLTYNAKDFSITVTAKSGALSHTAGVKLTVK